jgi:hypothetical protein
MALNSSGLPTNHSGHLRGLSNDTTSAYSSPMMLGIPVPPPSTPSFPGGLNPSLPFLQASTLWTDPGVRSSSVHSNVPFPTLPAVEPGSFQMATEPWKSGNHLPHQKVEFRIPSDQLQKLLAALDRRAVQKTEEDTQSMPPPPLPSNSSALEDVGKVDNELPSMKRETTQDSLTAAAAIGRRGESHSNVSDISMHTECIGFPACTTEGIDGSIIHSTRCSPADMIRGRKEASKDSIGR